MSKCDEQSIEEKNVMITSANIKELVPVVRQPEHPGVAKAHDGPSNTNFE
jgi:hypothetical protein